MLLKNLVFPNCFTGLCNRSRLNLFTVHVWEFYKEIAQKKILRNMHAHHYVFPIDPSC